MRLLWLLPDLGTTAAPRQTALVVPELARLGHDVTVAVLRSGGALTPILSDAGVTVCELATPHDLPGRAVYELARLLRSRPFDVLHAWRLPAVRAAAVMRRRPRLVASQARRGGRPGPFDRLLLLRAEFRDDVPLAVAAPPATPAPLGFALPAGARLLMCLGALTAGRGFREALWAFDVLKFVYPELELAMIGDGPRRERLMEFARSIGDDMSRIHFLRGRPDGPAVLGHAAVVWVPSRRSCGEQVVLEAQAAGVPVVASSLPALAALIDDGRTGLLVPPGEPVELAKATRRLLDDAGLHKRITENSCAARAVGHAPAEVAGRWAAAYAGS